MAILTLTLTFALIGGSLSSLTLTLIEGLGVPCHGDRRRGGMLRVRVRVRVMVMVGVMVMVMPWRSSMRWTQRKAC